MLPIKGKIASDSVCVDLSYYRRIEDRILLLLNPFCRYRVDC